MTLRNADTRLIKLESHRKHNDQFLAVWRKPGTKAASALADAKFSGGDRVICFEWFEDGPLPAPKWHRNQRAEFNPEEQRSIDRALNALAGADEKSAPDDRWLVNMTDGDLLHRLWGAA